MLLIATIPLAFGRRCDGRIVDVTDIQIVRMEAMKLTVKNVKRRFLAQHQSFPRLGLFHDWSYACDGLL
ncbi:unnamed protein product [Meloidogyne enterolobii]